MSLSQALEHLNQQDKLISERASAVDAFIDGVEAYAKSAGLSNAQYTNVWRHIGNVLESIPEFEKSSAEGDWLPQLIGRLKDPEVQSLIGRGLQHAAPGALGGLLVSALGGGKHLLRNVLLGGGLTALGIPAYRAIQQWQQSGDGVPTSLPAAGLPTGAAALPGGAAPVFDNVQSVD
jgi:hypothetical protein